MKKRLLFILVTALMLTSLCACGKKNKDKEDAAQPNTTQETTDSVKQEKKEEPKEEPQKDPKALYEAFLNGEEPLYFNNYIKYYNSHYDNELDVPSIEMDKPYMLPEFIGAILDYLHLEEYGNYSLDKVQYAYIDCGMDGVPELAIRFPDIVSWGSESECFVVIKEFDNKLQVCFEQDFGYRCSADINEYGYVKYNGSGGAAVHYYRDSFLDANGEDQLVCELETTYGVYSMYFPDMVEGVLYAESLGITDSIMFEGYCFDDLLNKGKSYEDVVRGRTYTYYQVSENCNVIEDDSIYNDPDNPYYSFAKETHLNIVTPDEIEKLIADHKKAIGYKEEIEKGDTPIWTTFYYAGIDVSEVEEEVDECVYSVVKNPSWEYYSTVDYDPNDLPIVLTQTSKKANDIIDDDLWLDEIGENPYDPNYCADEVFEYFLSGEGSYEPYIIDIYNKDSSDHVAHLDMSEFTTPPKIAPGDEPYVNESVIYVQYAEGLYYVAMSHRTYANSAPQNAYIIALDPMNDYQVVWKSQPLVSNAYNFQIVDNTIICGYGFTAEKDYIYLLDKNSGVQTDVYPVKTGPDYIFVKGGTLYVRTYDTNYEYQISFG